MRNPAVGTNFLLLIPTNQQTIIIIIKKQKQTCFEVFAVKLLGNHASSFVFMFRDHDSKQNCGLTFRMWQPENACHSWILIRTSANHILFNNNKESALFNEQTSQHSVAHVANRVLTEGWNIKYKSVEK